MRIALVLHQFPPYVSAGGTEQLVSWTAAALRRAGHTVNIVSAIPRHAEAYAAQRHAPGENEVTFVPTAPARSSEASRIRAEYEDDAMGAAFVKAVTPLRADVVHFFHLAGLTTAALRASVAQGIASIVTCTDFWFECPTVQRMLADGSICAGPSPDRLNCARHLAQLRYPRLRGLERAVWADPPLALAFGVARRLGSAGGRLALAYDRLRARSDVIRDAMRDASAVLAPTPYMRRRLLEFGIPEAKVRLVPYGIPGTRPREALRPETGPLHVAFIGTLALHKGPHLIVQALQRAPSLGATLDLYGDVADVRYGAWLRSIAGGDPRISFRGSIPVSEVDAVLASADLLVIPSLWDENAPLVALQAVAARCPVLAADVPGLRECVDAERDGWLFTRADVSDLGARLASIARDRSCLRDIRARGAPTRTIQAFVADLLGVYEDSLATTGTRA